MCIINYVYTNNKLLQKEIISKETINANDYKVTKRIIKYEYDSSGKIVIEKDIYDLGDSSKVPSITIIKKEYDNGGYLIKEYEQLPYTKELYLHYTYFYNDGVLSKVNAYNFKNQFIYSYLHEYDEQTKTRSVYLYNDSKTLQNEYIYDNEKKIIQEKDYGQGRAYLNHTTQTYTYNSAGLLESQIFQGLQGENYYYKHYYTKGK